MESPVGQEQIHASGLYGDRLRVSFGKLDLREPELGSVPTRPLDHPRREVKRDVADALAGAKAAEGDARAAGGVDNHAAIGNLADRQDARVEGADIGAPHGRRDQSGEALALDVEAIDATEGAVEEGSVTLAGAIR